MMYLEITVFIILIN